MVIPSKRPRILIKAVFIDSELLFGPDAEMLPGAKRALDWILTKKFPYRRCRDRFVGVMLGRKIWLAEACVHKAGLTGTLRYYLDTGAIAEKPETTADRFALELRKLNDAVASADVPPFRPEEMLLVGSSSALHAAAVLAGPHVLILNAAAGDPDKIIPAGNEAKRGRLLVAKDWPEALSVIHAKFRRAKF